MENIELRSENVRKIIGKIPPVLIRSGIGIIAIILVLLLAAAAFIPYPETLEGQVVITKNDNGHVYVYAEGKLPYSHITQVKPGMRAEIEMEGYNAGKYGYQHGVINSVSQEVITINGENYFSFTVALQNNPMTRSGMKGKVSVILSDKTLLKRILSITK